MIIDMGKALIGIFLGNLKFSHYDERLENWIYYTGIYMWMEKKIPADGPHDSIRTFQVCSQKTTTGEPWLTHKSVLIL